ncbi:hypothetical protein OFO10_06840 [Campylobacter sp. VBCF_06 NA8]|uniref:hypothetical protein n=1 Tax=unclassified Campylobacter TaxID=2593542 RepID=UPI0022E9CFE5|nr:MULTISPECIES: hypothetical protein [unclassified Campylobacter]MDA3046871.1 hypothetical protein [Campylobacter sp. VBCF_06 NA8]MDA3048468.1 hypothetical protein [Campylobacter sp. JMF_08 NE1]MDA3058080.1 hypothetical protein [Campylobacter sp. VBCF_04 NA7]MDA3059365.1 hypothetical protein [Campylobacter sp. VBCF_05 NA6]
MKELVINSKMFSNKQIDYIYKEYFGYHTEALYGWGNDFFSKQLKRELTDAEEAEIFLALFKRLIDDGIILVRCPIDNETEKEIRGIKFWNTTSDKIVEYIREVFPKNLIHLKGLEGTDDEYIHFWYQRCPYIGWVDKETGKIY